MQLPGLVFFRLCTLDDAKLAVAEKIPSVGTVPANPDKDIDLLIGELILRFLGQPGREPRFGKYRIAYKTPHSVWLEGDEGGVEVEIARFDEFLDVLYRSLTE